MQIFPDTSPERPVHLSCTCGEHLVLTAPPETWPLPCPSCGENVRVVDPETVRPSGSDAEAEERRLLARPEESDLPAVRSGGAVAGRGGDGGVPGFVEDGESYELTTRSFTGRVRREKVRIRPPEAWGMETLALALWLAAALAVMIGHHLLTGGDMSALGFLVQSALFAGVTVIFVMVQRPLVTPTLAAPRRGGFFLLLAAGGIPVTVGAVFLYFYLFQTVFGTELSDSRNQLMGDESASLPVLIVAIGVLPGFFEELGFRGWMQSIWRKMVPPGRALVLTACAFTAVHFSVISIGWILPMGLYLGWLRERSGSIWPGVIAHMGHNTSMVLIAHFAS